MTSNDHHVRFHHENDDDDEFKLEDNTTSIRRVGDHYH
jgi:hypothetical protein